MSSPFISTEAYNQTVITTDLQDAKYAMQRLQLQFIRHSVNSVVAAALR